MSRRDNSDSDGLTPATEQKKPWIAPTAEAQPVRAITAGLSSPNTDGTSGCHS
ncbi:MAG TPA: hypothetical protein VF547_00820 [Allosphingosinicella sp.]|jgi:hypothetical protein